MRVFLVRHGETDANVSRLIQGQSGAATLTERGKTEVGRAATFLRSELTTTPRVWASDLSRASESAHLMCTLFGLPRPELCPELRQRNWGSSEGHSYDDRVGETAYTGTPGCDLPWDAEPVHSVSSRLGALVKRVRQSGDQEHVVISHNETLNYLLDLFQGTAPRKRHFVGGEVVVVELDDRGRAIDRPRSVFPRRLVYVPDVRSFLKANEAIKFLERHDLAAVPDVNPSEEYDVVGLILGDMQFGVENAKKFPRLRALCRFGTGFDNVDVSGLRSQCHVTVARTPGVNTREVASYSVAALVILLRDSLAHATGIRGGLWRRNGRLGLDLPEAVVGVIGCGPIGLEVARRLREGGANVLVWNRSWPPGQATKEEVVSLKRIERIEDLVRRCDAISVHVAHARGSPPLLDSTVFQALREAGRKPVLVNTARGPVVDEHALLVALDDGSVRAAAIDVWSAEKEARNETVDALRNHPSVFPTPHIAGRTHAVIERSAMACAQNIAALVEGRRSEVSSAIVAAQ
jgi:phosphoglycerate dehydrogenase-like enzyme/broad specificity phosphatase PhoE